MHIDIPSVILGMTLFNAIFGLLSAFYLATSYILPEDSMIYEQLASQRLMYLT